MPRLEESVNGQTDARRDRAHASIYIGMIALARGIDRTHQNGLVAKSSGVVLERALHPILTTLGERGPLRTTALAEALALTPSTVSRHVSRLVELGYVGRVSDDEDGRAFFIELSPAGQGAFELLRSAWESFIAHVFADTGSDALEQFATQLNAFGDGLANLTRTD